MSRSIEPVAMAQLESIWAETGFGCKQESRALGVSPTEHEPHQNPHISTKRYVERTTSSVPLYFQPHPDT
jgi:hypothetical protein